METGGGPLPGATRVEVDAGVGAEGIDRRESAAVGAELSGREGWRGGNSAGPASVVARLSPGTGRRSKDVEVDRPGDVRQRLRWISPGAATRFFFSSSSPDCASRWSSATPATRPPRRRGWSPAIAVFPLITGPPPPTAASPWAASAAPLLSSSAPTRLRRLSPPPAPGIDEEPWRWDLAPAPSATAVAAVWGGGPRAPARRRRRLVARHRVVTAAASPTGLLPTRRLGCQ
uniref:Uncharacterized protein n=1 Tax=Oryza meridionalis TaxID=40149 RepID=A0A0E0CWR1_9ORYZ